MEKWSKVKLGEIAFITSSKRIFAREYQKEGIPFYRGKEIIEKHNGNSVSTELYISKKRYDEIKSKYGVPVPGDILLSSVGTLGVPWLVDEEKFYFKDGNLTWLRCNEKCIPKFLYLWFNSAEAKNQIEVMCIGSTQKALTIDALNKFNVSLPPLEVQKKICNVIYSIMDKIRTNDEINRNLSELLNLMYKNDYLDEVVNHKDWIEVTMDDITSKFATGLNPRKNFVLGHGENYYVTIKNMNNNRVYLDSKCDMVDDDALVKINKRSDLQVGDLLFSGIGTIGRVHLIDEPPTNWNISESIFTMRPSKVVTSEFLYLLLLSYDMQDYALSLASGSVQKGIRMADLKRYKLYLPSKEDMDRLTFTWKPLIDQIKKFERENDELAILRDTLLRKLMSGELDVSNLNI